MLDALLLPTSGLALLILLLLGAMSIATWAVIGLKWVQFYRVRRQNNAFLRLYRKSNDTTQLTATSARYSGSPLARTFEALWREMNALRRKEGALRDGSYRSRATENLLRSAEAVWLREHARLTSGLMVLALVASSAPYIGLFGTVLGVIDAFAAIGTAGVTSLSVVAPGLSEALIATAAGLFAAIPAMVLHHVLRARLAEMAQQTQVFAMEMLNRIERLW